MIFDLPGVETPGYYQASSGRRAKSQLCRRPLMILTIALLMAGVAAVAAPRLLFGLLHQSILDRIAMHVVQLLYAVVFAALKASDVVRFCRAVRLRSEAV